MRAMVTGGAGCIGSELVERLLKEGHEVVVYDNFSTGKEEHIEAFSSNKKLHIINGDILDLEKLTASMNNIDVIFHLAAYSTTKFQEGDPTDTALKNNIIGTYNVLEAMRINEVKNIIFTSSQAVYGEGKKAFSEESQLNPISFYGASKAAGEQFIRGFCSSYGMRSWIFRFANVVGGKSRKSGGNVITDFVAKLRKNPAELEVLGDGTQEKSYLTIDDCVDAILFCFAKSKENVNVFNIASTDTIKVADIASIVIAEMKLKAAIRYTGGDRGWKGDVPYTRLDTSKITKLGWKARFSSGDSIRLAARASAKNVF
ncbi:MAG: SDR family NAD(P)-dependent oxidoreductase [Candidatus Aenigmarchaeota archaeon]|nr:SDR family NAD(P)-dependent oxidoreductase [Candidatus Aenigmarchaeota archaeon]